MKKKIFIITGVLLCILTGIVIVPSVIRTRQAVKEFEKDFHASANSGTDSAGTDSEDEPAAKNEEVSEEEEKKAFELDTYLDHRDMTHRLYIYDMDYIEKAISFEKKSLQDFEEVIQQNPKIPDKFKPLMEEYCKCVFEKYPDVELRPFYQNLQSLEVVECTEDELLKVSWDVYSCGCYVKSENKIYVLKDKEYEEGTWDYQVIFHELSHCLRDSHYTDEDGNKVYIQFAGLNYYDVPNAEAINSLFAVSLFDYEENDIAYQMQSNAHKIMIECMDNYSLDDYVNHSLGYYAKQLDEYNQDDNYATTILTLMDEQYHDYYDEKTAENPEKYYPIYDYISNMYLGKHLKAGMSQEEARGIMDEMLEKLLFDVPEEYHIDRDHFYEYLEKYYTEKFSAA